MLRSLRRRAASDDLPVYLVGGPVRDAILGTLVKDLDDPAVMQEAAIAAGLDMARFAEDQADPELLKDIAESHTTAVEEYGAFGVPTFVFDEGKPATFLKMFIPPDEQAVEIYETMTKAMRQFDHVGEFKRPQPPWPHGVI